MTDRQYDDIKNYVREHGPITARLRELVGNILDIPVIVDKSLGRGAIQYGGPSKRYIKMGPANYNSLKRRIRDEEIANDAGRPD